MSVAASTLGVLAVMPRQAVAQDIGGSLAFAAASAGVGQLTNDPSEWGKSWRGYGRRVASAAGQQFVQLGASYSLAPVFHQPAEYVPSGYAKRADRMRAALLGVVADRTSSGGHVPAWPRIIGAYAGAAARASWWPGTDNRPRDAMIQGTTALAFSAVVNLAIERRESKRRR